VANGLPLEDALIHVTAGFSYQSAYNQALAWIGQWKKVPEAVVCFSDNLAMGLIHALNKKGYKVPKDISIIGFDDAQFSYLFSPPLTTIKQNKKEIAETAGTLLLNNIKTGKKSPTQVRRIPVDIIIRESTLSKKH
jgi:DNA-binding LacI/PurR family transcriptional regulator